MYTMRAMSEPPPLDALLLDEAYAYLRQVARQMQRRQGAGSLHATSVVHEVYERLAANPNLVVRDRSHLLAIGTRALRHVLADRARRRLAAKRGGHWQQVSLTGLPGRDGGVDLVALDQALAALTELDPLTGQVVELAFLGGLTEAEVAQVLDLSERTVRRRSRAGRAWLQVRLDEA